MTRKRNNVSPPNSRGKQPRISLANTTNLARPSTNSTSTISSISHVAVVQTTLNILASNSNTTHHITPAGAINSSLAITNPVTLSSVTPLTSVNAASLRTLMDLINNASTSAAVHSHASTAAGPTTTSHVNTTSYSTATTAHHSNPSSSTGTTFNHSIPSTSTGIHHPQNPLPNSGTTTTAPPITTTTITTTAASNAQNELHLVYRLTNGQMRFVSVRDIPNWYYSLNQMFTKNTIILLGKAS